LPEHRLRQSLSKHVDVERQRLTRARISPEESYIKYSFWVW
jgi:hypothetical protein